MENYFFKTNPYTFTDHVNDTRTVVGIHARINTNIVVQIPRDVSRGFFIDFMLETGARYGSFNVTTKEFVSKAVAGGAAQEEGEAQILQIVQALEFGNDAQVYAAASALAGIYGYTLAPIEEQNGDPLYVAPVEPEPESEPENPE